MFSKTKKILSITNYFKISRFFSKEGISNSSENPLYDSYRDFHNIALEKLEIPGITIIKSKKEAENVISILKSIKERQKI